VWLFWKPIQGQVDKVRLAEVTPLRVEKSHPAAVGAVRGMAANGYVVAARRAALSADTPGRIVELNVTEGSVVKQGDVVARLYSDEYAAAARRAEADLTAAQAGLSRAKAALESAKAEVARSPESATADAATARPRSTTTVSPPRSTAAASLSASRPPSSARAASASFLARATSPAAKPTCVFASARTAGGASPAREGAEAGLQA